MILLVGLGGTSALLAIYLADGETPLLISKPTLKALGGEVIMRQDIFRLTKMGREIPLTESKSGH